MKGDEEIAAMRAAGPPRQYFNIDVPLLTLLRNSASTRGALRPGPARSRLLVIQNRSAA